MSSLRILQAKVLGLTLTKTAPICQVSRPPPSQRLSMRRGPSTGAANQHSSSMSGRRPRHEGGRRAVGEQDARGDVHLPQLHGAGPLPAFVVTGGAVASWPARSSGGAPVPDRSSCDRAAARRLLRPGGSRWSEVPARMEAPHLEHLASTAGGIWCGHVSGRGLWSTNPESPSDA